MAQSRFDEVVDRRKTGSLKWDGTQKRFGVAGDDLLPMWVADTEFLTPAPVIEALVRRARHGVFGYSVAPAAYFEAVQGWMRRRHGWDVAEEWMTATPGVVCAVNLLIRTLTDRGDGVVIQPPVYYPFRRGIEDNGCRVLVNRLCLDGERYRMDLDDLERKLPDAKLLILCSPHNPVGRVWSADELRTLGELCLRHGVIVVSDEIHFDLVFPGHSHTVFATLSPELAQQSVVCTAASKTFNLPGLQPAISVIPNPRLRRDFSPHPARVRNSGAERVLPGGRHGGVQRTARNGSPSCWHTWKGMWISFAGSSRTEIPQLRVVRPEGTFLAWLDCRALGLDPGELERLLLSKGRLVLSQGHTFGPGGEGFVRMNLGCPRSMLEDGLGRLARAVRSL